MSIQCCAFFSVFVLFLASFPYMSTKHPNQGYPEDRLSPYGPNTPPTSEYPPCCTLLHASKFSPGPGSTGMHEAMPLLKYLFLVMYFTLRVSSVQLLIMPSHSNLNSNLQIISINRGNGYLDICTCGLKRLQTLKKSSVWNKIR